jgi:uncharacterized protein YegL
MLFALPATTHAQDIPTADCTIVYDKTATPTEVDAGGMVSVTLTLQSVGDCSSANSSVDVILVIDRSGSMSGTPMADAKSAAISFISQMNLTVDQIGVASFASSSDGRLDQELSQNATEVEGKIDSLFASGMTDIAEGLALAEDELKTARRLAGNAPVIIILSDGEHNEFTDLFGTADRIKQAGIRIISIGLGAANEYQLLSIASSSDDYYYAPDSSSLSSIYQSIASTVRVAARSMVLTDTLSSHVTLLDNSFQGPVMPSVNGNEVVWQIAAVPTAGMALSYQVAMTDQAGTWPTNDSAVADYIDAEGNAADITFPVPMVAVKSQCGAPFVYEVQPTWACQVDDIDLSVTGAGFFEPTAWVGSQSVSVLSSSEYTIDGKLNASGMALGVYDVTVEQCTPDPSSYTLFGAFTLYGVPSVLEVRPSEGFNDAPVDLVICDTEPLAPGTIASITVPTGTVTLENQFIQDSNPACLQATVPVGDESWAGVREISLTNACGTTPSDKTGNFNILPSDLNDDLWGRSSELWVDPSVVAFSDEDIKIGQIVHRRGGKDPIQNLKVTFYENDPNGDNAIKIDDGNIPLLAPRVSPTERISGTSTSAVGWIPSNGPGIYTLYAVIDPDNNVPEDIEDNNVVSRTVQIVSPLSADQDQVAPRVDNLTVAGGASLVYSADVSLEVAATDFAQQNVTPSGVQQMYFVEFIFNESAGIWEPVQSSGWISFTQNTDWSLVQQSGMRYIQAWVSDGVGKISRFPYQRMLNYTRPCETLSRDGRRVYSVDVKQGDVLEVEVIACSGDPDLYIWPPDWENGAPPWVSNRFNNAKEYIRIPAVNTEDGVYQVEVYGYSRSSYSIQIEVSPGVSAAGVDAAAQTAVFEDVGKDRRPDAPAVPASSAPPVIAGNPPEPVEVPAAQSKIYLPFTNR